MVSKVFIAAIFMYSLSFSRAASADNPRENSQRFEQGSNQNKAVSLEPKEEEPVSILIPKSIYETRLQKMEQETFLINKRNADISSANSVFYTGQTMSIVAPVLLLIGFSTENFPLVLTGVLSSVIGLPIYGAGATMLLNQKNKIYKTKDKISGSWLLYGAGWACALLANTSGESALGYIGSGLHFASMITFGVSGSESVKKLGNTYLYPIVMLDQNKKWQSGLAYSVSF